MNTKLKPKRCSVCRSEFVPMSSFAKACSVECAVTATRQHKAKIQRKADCQRRAELKTLSQLLKDAQVEFNKFIRIRDFDLPCISCGAFGPRKWDAGHYLSVGAHRELRFDEVNCQKQCVTCNQHKSGNQAMFRIGLLMRYGEAEVARLEGPHEIPHYTKDDARAIKAKYKAKLKALTESEKN